MQNHIKFEINNMCRNLNTSKVVIRIDDIVIGKYKFESDEGISYGYELINIKEKRIINLMNEERIEYSFNSIGTEIEWQAIPPIIKLEKNTIHKETHYKNLSEHLIVMSEYENGRLIKKVLLENQNLLPETLLKVFKIGKIIGEINYLIKDEKEYDFNGEIIRSRTVKNIGKLTDKDIGEFNSTVKLFETY